VNESLSEYARVVLACVRDYPGMSLSQIVAVLHIEPNYMATALSELERHKLIRREVPEYPEPYVGVPTYYPN